MRSRNHYESQLRFNKRTKSRPCDGKSVTDDPQLILDYLSRNTEFDTFIRGWKLDEGIKWILGYDRYILDKKSQLNAPFINQTLPPGTIVLCDFYGHMGTELTFEHPAIVLTEVYGGIVICPISSKSYQDGVSSHIDLPQGVPTMGDLPYASGIKLEQTRFISKSRVLKKFKRVSDNAKLMEINLKLTKELMPFFYSEILKDTESNNDILHWKEQEIRALKEEKVLLEEELRLKSEKILELEKAH
ncbi:type II toxin-antitoxin system PemK/MazF family toxin [Jeotgalibacillus proteolyticus]|uniref:Uncharacterized protein n=1 Tax=Jeotgalibacillus proteolyticus TaxID=2082395 RepID=A0A2S5G6T5_9BACL|nr:type II toxin-antitoxin system PemK/MazF family toxin [Jeotgalibacillus proteolyticus]PPA68696.1 hypothetical protein C4B60_19185 [Jeotgalibacillus proteolyticus]PPA68773.1 hypothetical protein C4B60_19615 [Jeotgalibacillus proteolyticus]